MTPTKKESLSRSPHNKHLRDEVYTHQTSPHKQLERVNNLFQTYSGCWLYCKNERDRLLSDAEWYRQHSNLCLLKAEQKEFESKGRELQLADYEELLHLAVNEKIRLESEVRNG